jgi:hypothetical protein
MKFRTLMGLNTALIALKMGTKPTRKTQCIKPPKVGNNKTGGKKNG